MTNPMHEMTPQQLVDRRESCPRRSIVFDVCRGGWEPKVPLETGLERMVAWASEAWTT